MSKAIKQVLNDTLKVRGKYSAKRLTAFASFAISCIITIYTILSGHFESVEFLVGEYLSAAMICFGITAWRQNFTQSNLDSTDSQDKNEEVIIPNACDGINCKSCGMQDNEVNQ